MKPFPFDDLNISVRFYQIDPVFNEDEPDRAKAEKSYRMDLERCERGEMFLLARFSTSIDGVRYEQTRRTMIDLPEKLLPCVEPLIGPVVKNLERDLKIMRRRIAQDKKRCIVDWCSGHHSKCKAAKRGRG